MKLNRTLGDAGRAEILQDCEGVARQGGLPSGPHYSVVRERVRRRLSLAMKGIAGSGDGPCQRCSVSSVRPDYVVTWGGTPGTWRLWGLKKGGMKLNRLGYIPTPELRLAGSDYTIWRKPDWQAAKLHRNEPTEKTSHGELRPVTCRWRPILRLHWSSVPLALHYLSTPQFAVWALIHKFIGYLA